MFGAWEAFAWDADDKKGYITNDDYPTKDVSKTYPVSLYFFAYAPVFSCPILPTRSLTTDNVSSYIFVAYAILSGSRQPIVPRRYCALLARRDGTSLPRRRV